jgi:hypothetical protein
MPAFIAVLILSSYCIAEEKWILVARSAKGTDYYIDKNDLTFQRNNTVLTWFKIVPDAQSRYNSRLKLMEFLSKGNLERYDYIKMLCSVDCSTKKLKILITSLYSNGGDLIHRDETLKAKWEDIPERTVFEDIGKMLCRKK